MPYYTPPQSNYHDNKDGDYKSKNPIVALILTLLLGPIGLFYITFQGGILLIIIMGLMESALIKSACWAVSILWAAMATNRPLMNRFEQFIGKKAFYQQDLPLYPLDPHEIADVDEGPLYMNRLNRKPPHSRHFFRFFQINEAVHSGLTSDYSPFFNTVVRPDINVLKDVQDINAGLGTIPQDQIEQMKKLKIQEFIYYGIALCFTLPFLIMGIKVFLLMFVTSIIAFLIIRPFKAYMAIEALEFEARQTEWFINNRVYGEQLNEVGQNVLYPKRGEGFYTLTGLDYLKLYALQCHKGDTEKSAILYQNLVKGILQNRNATNHHIREELKDEMNKEVYRKINAYGVKFLTFFFPKWAKNKNLNNLVHDPISKIVAIYDECCHTIALEDFI